VNRAIGARTTRGAPVHFLALLYDVESDEMTEAEAEAEMAAYGAFDELAGEAIVGGEALLPSALARTVRHDGGAPRLTAGPFAEVAEVLGGAYVLEADTLDDAIELARHLPAAAQPAGAVEVRPMVQWFDRRPADGGDRSTQVMATIHGSATDADDPGSSAWDEGAAEHGAFAEAAGDAVVAGGAVHPGSTATTLRVRDGELLVTDGPFSELTEVVGGFYVLDGTPERVDEVAQQIPVPPGGAVEVRPVLDVGA
jgi:hypothetical protein